MTSLAYQSHILIQVSIQTKYHHLTFCLPLYQCYIYKIKQTMRKNNFDMKKKFLQIIMTYNIQYNNLLQLLWMSSHTWSADISSVWLQLYLFVRMFLRSFAFQIVQPRASPKRHTQSKCASGSEKFVPFVLSVLIYTRNTLHTIFNHDLYVSQFMVEFC